MWTLCIMHKCVISRKKKKREKKRPRKKMRVRKKKKHDKKKAQEKKKKKKTDQVNWPLGGSFTPSMKSQFHPMVSIGSHWARVIQHLPAHHPSTGCLNTGFHRITLGQSDSTPAGAPSIHWMPEHRFPSDHTGPEWFSTCRHTIHPLDA